MTTDKTIEARAIEIRNACIEEAGRLQASDGKHVDAGIALATFANTASVAELIHFANIIAGSEVRAEERAAAAGEFPIAD